MFEERDNRVSGNRRIEGPRACILGRLDGGKLRKVEE